MSALNLNINPQVIAAQAAIFLTNLYLVKTFLLEPYLKLREKRESLTVGDKGKAEEIFAQCDIKQREMDVKIQEAILEAKAQRENLKKEALKKQVTIVEDAKKQAQTLLSDMRQNIWANVDSEQKKMPELIEKLTEEVYLAVLKS